jgi:succinate dehydrogenase / fumarate reductase, membrane anchor subunit
MVVKVTSLTGNGLKDWVIQRVSSLVVATYTIFMLSYLILHPQLDYLTWRELFTPLWMKLFSLLTLIAVLLHTYIGLWTVSTDYLRPLWIRFSVQMLIRLTIFILLIWGIQVLWSV